MINPTLEMLGDLSKHRDKVVEHEGMTLIKYLELCQRSADEWSQVELISRGIIFGPDGKCIARPYDKFFNWNERGRKTDAHVMDIREKMDGSLGISYIHPDGSVRIATRGSFVSEQAEWATEWFHNSLSDRPDATFENFTFLFEIVYPENRVVIDYDWSGLVLLDIRDIRNGNYIENAIVDTVAGRYGWRRPKQYSFNSVGHIQEDLNELPWNEEGYVALFSDGQRFKFKGGEYKKIHKILSNITPKNVVEHCRYGTMDEAMDVMPDEFVDEVKDIQARVYERLNGIENSVKHWMSHFPGGERKDFAAYVMEHCKHLAPYMFLAYDDKWDQINGKIYDIAFKDFE